LNYQTAVFMKIAIKKRILQYRPRTTVLFRDSYLSWVHTCVWFSLRAGNTDTKNVEYAL